MKLLTCPHCLKTFNHSEMAETRKYLAMGVLHEHGFSLREIGKFMSDAHPETVKYAIKKISSVE